MQDASLQAQLPESKADITRLKERLSIGTPTVHKDMSLISLAPKWSGSVSRLVRGIVRKYRKCSENRQVAFIYENRSLKTYRLC